MPKVKRSLSERVEFEVAGLDPDTIIVNPFDVRSRKDVEQPHLHLLRMMRNPDYFYFTCKSLMNGPNGKPLELLPFQCVILRELWYRPFPMLIASRGASKSFLLGLYSLLRALFIQGRKIVITGSGFRQAKTVFNYAETIWYNSPIFQSLVAENNQSGSHHDADRWWLRVGDSTITALPLGSGEKIRGERAHDIICDEFSSVPWEIFETVVSGFGVVELDPIESVRREAEIRLLKRDNLWTPGMSEAERKRRIGNQTIISGTGYYQFNHFADYWRRWKGIIESRGDKKILASLFPNGIDDKFDHRDYSIMRIPVKLLPQGFMDERQVARSRATQHTSIFLNEFAACAYPGTIVLTDAGGIPIEHVQIGDKVLTHKGRFRRVTRTMSRHHEGESVEYRTLGYGRDIGMTSEHPFWKGGDGWEPISTLEDHTCLTNLTELSGRDSIDIRPHVRDHLEAQGLVYPRPGNTRLTREHIEHIRSSSLTNAQLSRDLGIRYQLVWNVRNCTRARYNAIPPIIPLDEAFGKIVGYYAAEGSIGSSGRAASFALDGHVGESLEHYVDDLCESIRVIFGIEPKLYDKSDNCVSVTITQSLVADLLSWICPGLAATKYVRPDVLWSNADFLKGFLKGYWNGDGHVSHLSSSVSSSMQLSSPGTDGALVFRPDRQPGDEAVGYHDDQGEMQPTRPGV
jgi:hypothetical protein